jgi:hypothetical protein
MAAASFYTASSSTETGTTAAISSCSSDLLGSTGAEITPANFATLEKNSLDSPRLVQSRF